MSLDAILGGLSIGSSVATGVLGNQAANGQSDAAINASTQANALQKYIYDNNTKIAQPWLQQGGAAVNRLGWLLGLQPGAQGAAAPGTGTTSGGAPNPVNYLTNPLNTSYLNPAPGSLTGDQSFGGFGGLGLGGDGNGLFSPNPTPTPSGYISNTIIPPNDNPNPDSTNDGSYGPDGFLPPVSRPGQAGGGGKTDGGGDIGPGTGEVGGFTGDGEMSAALREGEGPIFRPTQPTALTPTAAPVTTDAPGPAQGQGIAPVQPATTTPAQGDSPSGSASDFGSLNHDFGLADFQTDPGYQFRIQQGQKTLEHSAASRGTQFSGGTLKALDDYNQNFASNEFGNAYNRFQINRTNKINPLLSLAGLGQQSAQQVQTSGTNYANNAGANTIAGLTGAANAQASGYASTANAINGGAGGISNLLLLRNLGIG